MTRNERPVSAAGLINIAYAFEGSLIGFAYLLGWFADINPLAGFSLNATATLTGILGTIPMFLLFLLFYRYPAGPLYPIKRSLIELLGPMLVAAPWYHLVGMAALAGLSEEMLFRGLLQPWVETAWGYWPALLVSNLIFGLLHWVTPMYALIAGLIGIYLGMMLDAAETRNLYIPVFIHGLYDYLAFLVVARSCRAEASAS